jgi:hypothetical protein
VVTDGCTLALALSPLWCHSLGMTTVTAKMVTTAEDTVRTKLLQFGCIGISEVKVSELGALQAMTKRGETDFGRRHGKLGYFLVSSLRSVR